jgi:hypothetical protein
MKHGYAQVYTGDGKRTAAKGLSIHAAGESLFLLNLALLS